MKKLGVICVDDQREVLNSVVRDLQPLLQWIALEECESADEALEVIEEYDAQGNPPALIISDHLMSGKNGVQLLTELKEDGRFPHLKKVLLTGQATHHDTIEAINHAKIDFYFEKPWQGEKLRQTCRRLLTDYLFETGVWCKDFHSFADGESMLMHMRSDE
ncbi:TPA: response regulator [Escherichia coli]|uniref:response regulator n=1 Tax=Escherichia coli TaxID=562 RepID=UPI000B9BB6B4|nr:response regulator [Escherichia coli]EJD6362630.1 response regulator [Escherichia coli]EKW0898456.1 response regulator [Escherichia coli]ELB7337530.1 response regulator [Escherichia coli]MBQ0375521.1 response regulator [Escherichia coli]MDV2411235.1 response regulator [Escherichia coli]